MKKIGMLFVLAFTILSLSLNVFAAPSPIGEDIQDQFNIIISLLSNGKPQSGLSATLNGEYVGKTDSSGQLTIKKVNSGNKTILLYKGTELIGTAKVDVSKGSKTQLVKNDDGSYRVYVGSGYTTVKIVLELKNDGNIEAIKAISVGNNSQHSPNTADSFSTFLPIALIVSFAGVVTTACLRRKRSI